MGPVESMERLFTQNANRQGGTSRSEHWWSVLFSTGVAAVLICAEVRRRHDLGVSDWRSWAFQLPVASHARLVASLSPSQPEGDRCGPGRAGPPATAHPGGPTTAPAPL